MTAANWTDGVLELVRDNSSLIEIVLFVLGFAESIVFFSFFIPASVLFLAIGGLHAASGGALWPLILAGAAGSFVGDLVSYWIGWYYRDRLPTMWPFNRHPEWLSNANRFFEKYGLAGIVLAKFVGPMRPLVPTISGAVSMPRGAFLLASAVSSIIWAIVFLVPSYYGVSWFTS
jgi:membrane protein DedA with SNARE-associated domain